MPRNQNGTYTLPAGNPVVPGTTIDTSWANPTMSDLANEMTNSLSRTGEGGMLVPFKNIDGFVGSPGISWTNESVTGFYRANANDMRVSVGAVDKFRWTATSVQVWNATDLIWENVATDASLGDYLPLVGGTVSGQIKGVTPLAPEDLARKDYVDSIEPGLQSFNTREAPDVIPQLGDYDAVIVGYDSGLTPIWNATEVQTALEEAYSDIQFLAGGIVLKGIWDSFANVPDLLTIPKINGNYWIVSVEGSTVLPAYPGAIFQLPYLVNDRVLYLDDGIDTGFAQIRQTAGGGDFLPLTGGTMLGQIKGVSPAPVAAADLTRKDYVDAQIAAIPPPDLTAYLPLVGGTLSGQVKGITPLDDADLTRKDYVLAAIAANPTGLVSFLGRTAPNVVPIYNDYQADLVSFDNVFAQNWGTDVQVALDDAYGNIQFLAGSVTLKGVWDALNNVPDLLTIPKVSGNYWIVSVEGSTVLPLFPGAPAFVLPYLPNDRILYLEDGLDTGFAQLRVSADGYLLLTGGTMSGQIKGITPVDAPDLTRKDYVDTKLPLSGGTLTGDDEILTLKRTAAAAVNSLNFRSDTNLNVAILAQNSNALNNFLVRCDSGDLDFQSYDAINLNAPTTSINGNSIMNANGAVLSMNENTLDGGNYIRFNNSTDWSGWVGIGAGDDTSGVGLSIVSRLGDLAILAETGIIELNSQTRINLDGDGLIMKALNASVANQIRFQDNTGAPVGYYGRSLANDLEVAATQNLNMFADIINLNTPTVNVSGDFGVTGILTLSHSKWMLMGGKNWVHKFGVTGDANESVVKYAGGRNTPNGSLAFTFADGSPSNNDIVNILDNGHIKSNNDITAFSGLANEISMSQLSASSNTRAGFVNVTGSINTTVTFSSPMSAAAIVTVTYQASSITGQQDVFVTSSSTTNFVVRHNNGAEVIRVNWIATVPT